MTTNKERGPRWTHKLVLGCTDRGRHRWTTLYTWRFYADGVEPDEDVRWTPIFPRETLELPCPRCGQVWRYGGKPGGRGAALAGMEPSIRAPGGSGGRHQLDISQSRF